MAFRLALAMGHANPYALLAQLPDWVWHEWQGYALLEPWWASFDRQQAGATAAFFANAFLRKADGGQWAAQSFIPRLAQQTSGEQAATGQQGQSARQMLALAGILNAALGGKDLRRDRTH